MKISNDSYLNLIKEQSNGFGNRRQERLENRRERLDQTFDELQQKAIDEGDAEKAQKIFKMSEVIENRLDRKLDSLEKKTGSYNWDRHLDNAFDELQAEAYENDDADMAEKIFGLSQAVKSDGSDVQKQLLLSKLLSDWRDTGTTNQVAIEQQDSAEVNSSAAVDTSPVEIRTFG